MAVIIGRLVAVLLVGGPTLVVVLGLKLRDAKARLKRYEPIGNVEVEVATLRTNAELEIGRLRAGVHAEVAQC